MLEIIKKNYVNICISIVYTTIASLVYGIWSFSVWKIWWVSLIIVLVILAVGVTISYFWINSEIEKQKEKFEFKKEKIEETNEEIVEK